MAKFYGVYKWQQIQDINLGCCIATEIVAVFEHKHFADLHCEWLKRQINNRLINIGVSESIDHDDPSTLLGMSSVAPILDVFPSFRKYFLARA